MTGATLVGVLLSVSWGRLPPAIAFGTLAACGACVGVGALLVQDGPGPGDWAIAPAVLAMLTPIHTRVLFGPPGTRR